MKKYDVLFLIMKDGDDLTVKDYFTLGRRFNTIEEALSAGQICCRAIAKVNIQSFFRVVDVVVDDVIV